MKAMEGNAGWRCQYLSPEKESEKSFYFQRRSRAIEKLMKSLTTEAIFYYSSYTIYLTSD